MAHKQLEIKEDISFQRREWTFQRIAWGLMAVLLIAGLLGFFGSGPLSEAVAGRSGDRLWIEYERFERRESPAMLRVHLKTQPGQTAPISISPAFLDGIRIERVDPVPEAVDGATYRFRAAGAELSITFHFQPRRPGRHRGRISAGSGGTVEISQFVYP